MTMTRASADSERRGGDEPRGRERVSSVRDVARGRRGERIRNMMTASTMRANDAREMT